jgi:hypothetical protein
VRQILNVGNLGRFNTFSSNRKQIAHYWWKPSPAKPSAAFFSIAELRWVRTLDAGEFLRSSDLLSEKCV